jgi:hypothetical protein
MPFGHQGSATKVAVDQPVANLEAANADTRLRNRPVLQAVACALVSARCGAPWHVTVVAA